MMVDLPMDVIEHILSFGDPEVTIKYKGVINQIIYYNKEYEYLRHKEYNFYYNWPKEDIIYFMFNRSYFKAQEGELKERNTMFQVKYATYRVRILSE